MIGAGILVFRIHGPRTDVFAAGLFPRRPGPESTQAAPPAVPPPPPGPTP